MTSEPPPPQAATYERAHRLANLALWTADLQYRRLDTDEPGDTNFPLRRWSDFYFFIVAMTRLRRAAFLASKIPSVKDRMEVALKSFDATLPNLKKMRDVAEHIDDYAMGTGRDKSINRKSLEVGITDGETWEWLGFKLDVGVALRAGIKIFE